MDVLFSYILRQLAKPMRFLMAGLLPPLVCIPELLYL